MCLATALLTLAAVFFFLMHQFGGTEGWQFISKINTVRTITEENFVGDVDWAAAADAASAGIVESIDDQWSYYMTAEEYESYTVRSENSTTGIGVTVQADEQGRGLLVLSVVEGAPAQRAGVKAGDIIIAVAGQSAADMDVNAVAALIRSQTGEYTVTLLSADGVEYSVTLANELVFTNPVVYEMMEDSVGYIRIDDFEKGAAEEGVKAIADLTAQGAEALVFDVRSNPGGRLNELIDLLDYILPEGEVFISVGAEGDEEIYYSDADCIDLPIAVLIDANSYSAAEFFAAALSEYDYAEVVGQASTGKARSQMTYVLTDGSAVHISTRSYLTPNRVNLAEEGGLVPDVEVAFTGEGDAQLEAALELLQAD